MNPLLYQNIEFHNAEALEPFCGFPGVCPVRIPSEIRNTLEMGTRSVAALGTGIELRFVAPGGKVRIALFAPDKDVQLHVYRGEYGHSEPKIPAGGTRVLTLEPPERFPFTKAAQLNSSAFSPDLWRIVVNGERLGFLGVEADGVPVRPPLPEEKPRVRWLAYGSSITQSWAKGYVHQAARRLGVDVLNKGMSGNCHVEPEMADYLAGLDWDVATLELGVNMRVRYTPDEFERRVRHLLASFRSAKPKAPLFFITIFRNLDHFPVGTERAAIHQSQEAFDEILRTVHRESGDPNLHLLEGLELLSDFRGLSCDLLHPSDFGHLQMGENLARAMKQIL